MLTHILNNNIIFYKPMISMLLITEVLYLLQFIITDYNLNYLSRMLSYCAALCSCFLTFQYNKEFQVNYTMKVILLLYFPWFRRAHFDIYFFNSIFLECVWTNVQRHTQTYTWIYWGKEEKINFEKPSCQITLKI